MTVYTDEQVMQTDLSGLVHRGWTDIRGWLLFDAPLPDPLQQREDATQANDYEHRSWRPSVSRTRPATLAERLLLEHLGFEVPEGLETVVAYPSGGVRRRTWTALISQWERMTADGND